MKSYWEEKWWEPLSEMSEEDLQEEQQQIVRCSLSSARCDLIAWDTREISVFTIVVHEKDDRKLKISRQKLEKKEYYVLGHNGIAFQKKCYIIRKLIDWHLLLSMYSAFSNCFMSCNISWMSNSLKAQNFKSSAYKGNGSLEGLDFSI